MTLPTHLLFYVTVSNILGIPYKWDNLILGLAGTVLPDISNPYGGIGKILRPVSSYINQKWGHRSITHSWAMVIFASGAAIVLKVLTDDNSVYLLVLAVACHISLDMMNISGVRFFYPDSLIAVIPAEHEVRIGTGSKREKRLAFALLVLAIVTAPLGIWGYISTIRYIAGSHTAAVEEYKSFVDTYEIFVEVTTGINRITQEPVRNRRFRMVAAMPKKLTLIETEEGKRLTIGQVEEAIIETKKMRVIRGVPIKTQVVQIDAGKVGWEGILRELESPYSYVIGTVLVEDKVTDYRPEIDQWEGIEIKDNMIVFSYSGIAAVRKVMTHRIVEGTLKVRKEMSEEGIVAALTDSANSKNQTVSFLVAAGFDGLRVTEGQLIKKGDIVAVDPEISKVRAEIAVLRARMNTSDIEEQKAEALQDRSLQLKRQIEVINKNIEVQRVIAEKANAEFKEAERSRLERLEKERESLLKEVQEVERSIEEQKDYILRRKEAMKKELEAQIGAKEAQIEAMVKRSPVSGKVKAIRQKSANVSEIVVEEVNNERGSNVKHKGGA